MPVQRLSFSPSDRPSGQVRPRPDESGVTEIRVHGVGGATPEAQLTDLSPQQVAGDRVAGFYRSADAQGRHIEAYSWGGLTSRSGSRVFWVLLLPFMLANLAGWMGSRAVMERPGLARVHRWTSRWAALAITLNGFLIVALITAEVLGYQCGGQPQCVAGRWWLAPLGWGDGLDHPARRIVVGAAPLVLLALVLVGCSFLSRRRYESVDPPFRGRTPDEPPRASAASRRDGLVDPQFWHGIRSTSRFGRCHLAAVLAFAALTVLWTSDRTLVASDTAERLQPLWFVGVALAITVLVGSAALLAVEDAPDWSARALVGAGAALALIAAGWAWVQPAAPSPAVPLPGMRLITVCTYVIVAMSVLPALILSIWARFARDERRDEGTFPWGGPFVVVCLGILLLNMVLLGALIRVSALAGEVSYEVGEWQAGLAGGGANLFVYPWLAKVTPYLTLVPITLAILFVVVEVARYLVAGGRMNRGPVAQEYRDLLRAEIDDGAADARPPEWYVSPFTEAGPDLSPDPSGGDHRRRAQHRFAGRVARARWLGRANTHVGWLLIAIVGVTIVVLVRVELLVWVPPNDGPWAPDWFIDLGTQVAGALPLLVIALLRWGWSRPQGRRLIGVLWDVGTFWPRAYHPWAPPSYAERAVPELQRRMWWLHDSGGRVLLAAHSQGTIVAAAALLQRDRRADDDIVSLVTFGSPLRTLYRWAFPAYFTDETLQTLESDRRLRTWRNVHYRTDYIGGPVLPRPEGRPVDKELSDPAGSRHVYGQPAAGLRRHTGYWNDTRMWKDIDVIAADLVTAPMNAPVNAPTNAPTTVGAPESADAETTRQPPPG